jgi:hypothetical protein
LNLYAFHHQIYPGQKERTDDSAREWKDHASVAIGILDQTAQERRRKHRSPKPNLASGKFTEPLKG